MQTKISPTRNSMNSSSRHCETVAGLLIAFALAWFALSQTTQAVVLAWAGGYSNGNPGEGDNALFSLTTGSSDTAIGLIDSTTSNRPLWLRRYNGPGNGSDLAQAIAVSPDGTQVFVTGYSDGLDRGFTFDYATVAYDVASGRKLWLNRYNGSVGTDSAAALAVSPDGTKVFVTGFSGCLGTEDYATVAYDAGTGQELWVSRYDGPTGDPDEAYAVAVNPDGSRVFVTGRSFGLLGEGRDYATVAYDASTGQELWVRRYVGPGHGEKQSDDQAYAVAVSPDGNKVFVTGYSNGADSFSDYATLAYDANTGRKLWLARYDGANMEDFAQAMAVSPDGSKVFVTGYSYGVGSFSDYATVTYDAATGQELWLSRYDDPAHGFDFAYAVAASPDGTKVFVTGSSDGPDLGSSDYATLAYDGATGEKLWLRRYNGPGNGSDSAYAVAVSPDASEVFVTGFSSGVDDPDFPFDYTTLAYDTSAGGKLWLSWYNGPANHSDLAYDLAVSPDGTKVFVTGSSDGIDSGSDYATIAYGTVVPGP
jgi:DNA-binding beta-propeller fold protein YncE